MSSPTTRAATFLNNRSPPGDFHPRQRFSPRLLERAVSRHHYLPTAYPSQDVDCSHYYYSPPNRRRSIDPTHSHIRYNSPTPYLGAAHSPQRINTRFPLRNQLQYSGYNPTSTVAAKGTKSIWSASNSSSRSSSTKKKPHNKTTCKRKRRPKMQGNLSSHEENLDDDSHPDDYDDSTPRKQRNLSPPQKNTTTNINDSSKMLCYPNCNVC